MKKLVLLAGSAVFLLATSAIAQPGPHSGPRGGQDGPPPPQHLFDRADANEDGQVTQEEARFARGELFDRIDRDGDGYLEKPENRFFSKSRKAKWKMRRAERKIDRRLAADTNNDGSISEQEFMTAPSPMFDKLDANNDGVIDQAEHDNVRKQQFARLDVTKDGQLNDEDKKAAKEFIKTRANEMREKHDTDKDGRISRLEFISMEGPFFANFDLNEDGVVTQQELDTAPIPEQRFQRSKKRWKR